MNNKPKNKSQLIKEHWELYNLVIHQSDKNRILKFILNLLSQVENEDITKINEYLNKPSILN